MSFRCTKCSCAFPNPTAPEERQPHQVVTETRVRRYKLRDAIGYVLGWEIVKEAQLCTNCLAAHTPPTVLLTDEAAHDEKENHAAA